MVAAGLAARAPNDLTRSYNLGRSARRTAVTVAPEPLRAFDYRNVRLTGGRWSQQYDRARDFYLGVSNDDILCGFRRAAGMTAPGNPLGGWASSDSGVVFGQWLQAMARSSRATGDDELAEKAAQLVDGWAKTMGADGNPRMPRHYPWEKLVGGLADMSHYLGHPTAESLMERVVDWGIDHLDRQNVPAAREPWELHSGRVLEWYTLGENLYRAFEFTGKGKYKDFGDVWRYDAYWRKFADTSDPPDAMGVHAYSHCNSFSGAAMAYRLDEDPTVLQIIRNFYDFLQESQCYATGGYGPAERYVKNDGALGESLEQRVDSFEAPCCSWAALKLAKYLMRFTGEAHFGDWMERILYNGVGAALPIVDNGKHFYYADYHLGAGQKTYARSTYTCCSGTYFQGVSEYRDLICFLGDDALHVNLYLPSEVTWEVSGQTAVLRMDTEYPEGETVDLRLALARPAEFTLAFRVPEWSRGFSLEVNAQPVDGTGIPGSWASLRREWLDGDRVTLRIPLRFRREPIDRWHPGRVAIVRGPAVYAQQIPHKLLVHPPEDEDELNDWFLPTDRSGVFQFRGQVEASQRDDFKPFYAFQEMERYRLYTDASLRTDLW
jgi:DUF1680 family protein